MKPLLALLGSFVICCNGMVYADDDGPSFPAIYTAIGIEKFRTLMKTGNATLGIPVLDPFELKQYPFALSEDGLIDVQGLIRNLKAEGLASFETIKADFSIIGVKISLHLFWDSIEVSTDYSMRGTLANMLSIYGLGDVSADVRGLDIDVQLSVSANSGKPYLRYFQSTIKLKELDLNMTGLFYDEELSKLLSQIISDMVPQLIDDYQVELTEKVNTLASDFINDFIKDKSLLELIGLLT